MTSLQAMQSIEQPEFSALVNVANGYKVFLRLATSHDAVKTLAAAMDKPNTANVILTRMKELTAIVPDDGFEHPHDAALAVYLWLLGEISPRHTDDAITLIGAARRLHWANQVAQRLPIRRLSAPLPVQNGVSAKPQSEHS